MEVLCALLTLSCVMASLISDVQKFLVLYGQICSFVSRALMYLTLNMALIFLRNLGSNGTEVKMWHNN